MKAILLTLLLINTVILAQSGTSIFPLSISNDGRFLQKADGENYSIAASAPVGSYEYEYLAKGQRVSLVLDRFSSEEVKHT